MIVNAKMVYLGYETKESKKSGNAYLLAKFMESSKVFEFYVPTDKLTLVTDIGQLQQFTETDVKLEITSFNNKAQIDLVGVAALGKK